MTIPKRIDPELLDRFVKESQELEFPCPMEEGKNFVVKAGTGLRG